MLNFTNKEKKDIESFCKLNDLNFEDFIKKCFEKGYYIEKYGLLDGESSEPQIIEKEIIKEVEVPVEKIIEKEVIKEIENTKKIDELTQTIVKLEAQLKKKPKTVTKKVEVPVEVIVEKKIKVNDKEKITKLQNSLQEAQKELRKKEKEIEKLLINIEELNNIKGPIRAQFMGSSNLNDNLYK